MVEVSLLEKSKAMALENLIQLEMSLIIAGVWSG